MRLNTALVVFMIAFGTATIPTMLAAGGPQGEVHAGVDGFEEVAPPPSDGSNNIVDRQEPGNNECNGAEPWRDRTRDSSVGRLSSTDLHDWSRVELHRTESLTASILEGGAMIAYASSCGEGAVAGALLDVSRNGLYYLRASYVGAGTAYTIHYKITPHDASGPGTDVGNSFGAAWQVNALPQAGPPDPNAPPDPRDHELLFGALPNRPDQTAPDEDWFRIGTALAHGIHPDHPEGNLSLGLLTVLFWPDCNGGTYSLTLYQGDGETPIGTIGTGCGSVPVMRSCIAASFSPVFARTAVLDGSGTGYTFAADLSPVYVVDLSDGIPRTRLDSEQPWCDSITPVILASLGHLGVVDENGRIIAAVMAGLP